MSLLLFHIDISLSFFRDNGRVNESAWCHFEFKAS